MTRWLDFLVAVLLIELTPGPNMAWLVTLTLQEGRKSGFAAICGVAVGLSLMGCASIATLSALSAIDRNAMTWLRYPGGIILLGLAIQNWREASITRHDARYLPTVKRGFFIGLATNAINFKAFLFYTMVVPEFVPASAWTFDLATKVIGASVAVATAIHASIVLLAGQAKRIIFTAGPRKLIGRLLALGVAIFALWIIVQK